MAWYGILKIPRKSTLDQIQAAYTKAWSSVGDGNPELHGNVPVTHKTYMRLMSEIKEFDRAYHEALNEVKK